MDAMERREEKGRVEKVCLRAHFHPPPNAGKLTNDPKRNPTFHNWNIGTSPSFSPMSLPLHPALLGLFSLHIPTLIDSLPSILTFLLPPPLPPPLSTPLPSSSKVYPKYCSGDFFAGDVLNSTSYMGQTLYFRGAYMHK